MNLQRTINAPSFTFLATHTIISMTTTTTTNTGMIVSSLLSVVCLVVLWMGGWYFQSSLVELRTLVLHHQQDIAGQRSEILEQAIKVAEQAEIIHQLKEKLNEQDKQIDLILLELEEAQLKVMRDFFSLYSNSHSCHMVAWYVAINHTKNKI